MMFPKKSVSIFINATEEQVFSVITDYDSYAEWTVDVLHSHTLVREGDIVVAEFISPELIEGKYVLEFVHTTPTSVTYKEVNQYRSNVASTFISLIPFWGSRTTSADLSGSWEITESDDGQGVILTGEMRLKTTPWKTYANRKKIEMILQNRLESIKDKVLFTYSLEEDSSIGEDVEAEDRKKIIEIVQRGENIEVWFLGEKYELRKIQQD